LSRPYHESQAPKPRPRTGDDLWKSDTLLHRPLHGTATIQPRIQLNLDLDSISAAVKDNALREGGR